MIESPKSSSSLVRCLGAALVLVVLVGPALAASLKNIMGDMGDNTTTAKAVIANFDNAAAQKVLRRYAADAQAAGDMFASQGSAKEKDLRARFIKMATVADNASQSVQDKASFRKAFVAVAGECKSCHSTYK